MRPAMSSSLRLRSVCSHHPIGHRHIRIRYPIKLSSTPFKLPLHQRALHPIRSHIFPHPSTTMSFCKDCISGMEPLFLNDHDHHRDDSFQALVMKAHLEVNPIVLILSLSHFKPPTSGHSRDV
jgi:hypothetical protein